MGSATSANTRRVRGQLINGCCMMFGSVANLRAISMMSARVTFLTSSDKYTWTHTFTYEECRAVQAHAGSIGSIVVSESFKAFSRSIIKRRFAC